MQLRTLQWNIGGAFRRNKDTDPTLDESYCIEDVAYIAGVIKQTDCDLVTLQETHTNADKNMTEVIAKMCGYKYWINHDYDQSHVDPNFRLGQAILSRYPINSSKFSLAYNPRLQYLHSDGQVWISHNKGVSQIEINLGHTVIGINTLHFIPFRIFPIDIQSDLGKKVIKSYYDHCCYNQYDNYLLQGDFNFNEPSLKNLYPDIFEHGVLEVLSKPTNFMIAYCIKDYH